jgi:hypothetical protein
MTPDQVLEKTITMVSGAIVLAIFVFAAVAIVHFVVKFW